MEHIFKTYCGLKTIWEDIKCKVTCNQHIKHQTMAYKIQYYSRYNDFIYGFKFKSYDDLLVDKSLKHQMIEIQRHVRKMQIKTRFMYISKNQF
ncbi:hypothetical protein DERF_010383 [Dermatophagoides farinae]|uniref:Uncharacterized protein n=1 Tax=Dermatophagoides farinae TaxID=6954 RepID=A0A922HX39_DERFA|nr:hypothetical protein DERF_010383 [Dermatophagoides farinae]